MMLNSVLHGSVEVEPEEWKNFTSAENLWPHLNATFIGHTANNSTMSLHSMPFTCALIIRVTYAIGIVGNLAAVITLCRGDSKIRNRKHALLLRSLAINDLVALVGMMILMNIQSFLPLVVQTRWFCALRVVLRIFGLGSVCIAIVMALERWLALTQPFLYQKNDIKEENKLCSTNPDSFQVNLINFKHVTYYVVRKALIALWAGAALLTCLPFLGFGIYYDKGGTQYRCSRYRDATEPVDVAYAYVVLTFGTLLCVCLVWCNLAVIRVLCRSSCRSGGDQRLLVRRISRTSSKGKPLAATNLNEPIIYNTATADEIAFSKLMATLSVCFIICWMPQMISILLAQLHPANERPFLHKLVFQIADILMLINYTLDPYIYVLLRGNSKPFPKCIKSIFQSRIFGKRCVNHQDSLRLASQQDGLTTTIEITPPPTTTNSPPWPKSLPTISSSESLQSPMMSKRSFLPKDQMEMEKYGSHMKDVDTPNSESLRNALNCLLKKNTEPPSLV